MAEKEVKIPDNIVKKGKEAVDAYLEYLEIENGLQNMEDRFCLIKPSYDVEDGSEFVELDLLQMWPHIKRSIGHLSELEQAEIKKKHNKILTLQRKKGHLKIKFQDRPLKKNAENIDRYSPKIMELYGQWKDDVEVKRIAEEEWGFIVSHTKLRNFRNKNKDKIAQLRKEWSDSYDEHELAQKKGRIEQLVYLYKTQKDKYRKDSHYPTKISNEMRGILDDIRKEVEGDKIQIDINGNIDINATLTINKTISQLTRRVNINNFILGIVAAQRGLDPISFMNALTNSYYAKYSGFGGQNNKPLEEQIDELSYPSNTIYNWNEIEEKHKDKRRARELQIEDAKIVAEDNTNDILKSRLRAILMDKKK